MRALILLAIFGLPLGGFIYSNSKDHMKNVGKSKISLTNSASVKNIYIPAVEHPASLPKATTPLSQQKLSKLKLEASNTLSLRGPVTKKSMADLMVKLLKMSKELNLDDVIYLVLATPGGDVFAGSEFIDLAKSIPQDIHTINLVSISMGFQISQHLGKRYALPSSLFMAHRASIRGLGGQFHGELESRLAMLKNRINYLDSITSKRVGLNFHDYQSRINPEWWINGFSSVSENVSDEVIQATCGRSLRGTVQKTVRTIFGPVIVTFSKCPLIKAPLKMKLKRSNVSHSNRSTAIRTVETMFTDPLEFVRNGYKNNLKVESWMIQ